MRPAHGNLPTNLHYSAACVETTLPSGAVAAQRDGKTRCCGNSSASADSPIVHSIYILLYMFVGADGERSRRRRRSATDAAYPSRVHIGPLGTDEFAADFHENGAHCAGRCGHRPLQHAVQNRNKPSIPEMSRNEIDTVCPQMCVVHLSEP